MSITHLLQKREQGTGNRQQGRIIDNLWIRIDFLFDFWRCLLHISYDKNRTYAEDENIDHFVEVNDR
ncbi:MAG: hypothetical protein F6K39_42760 [Okeania sp. SIO3B3]|nr:hypothetical protein [Okeania sp. SIO3B3]